MVSDKHSYFTVAFRVFHACPQWYHISTMLPTNRMAAQLQKLWIFYYITPHYSSVPLDCFPTDKLWSFWLKSKMCGSWRSSYFYNNLKWVKSRPTILFESRKKFYHKSIDTFCFIALTMSVTQNIRGATERHCLSKGTFFNQQDKDYNLYLKIIRLITLINLTKRYQLARKMTNICDLCEFQSFVVHEEHCRLLRHQTAKNVWGLSYNFCLCESCDTCCLCRWYFDEFGVQINSTCTE